MSAKEGGGASGHEELHGKTKRKKRMKGACVVTEAEGKPEEEETGPPLKRRRTTGSCVGSRDIQRFSSSGVQSPVLQPILNGCQQPRSPQAESENSGNSTTVKKGYLNKKNSRKFFSKWKRRYLVLTQSDITYYLNLRDYQNETPSRKSFKLQHITIQKFYKRNRSWPVGVEGSGAGAADLSNESRKFNILSMDKTYVFRASDAKDATEWVEVINKQITKAYEGVNLCSDQERKEIFNIEGNGFCVDCNSPNPKWCSLNHGCLLCINCSGVHRNLGSRISRIRSLTLDNWTPELVAVMLSIGNRVSQGLWEAKKPRVRPIHSSSRKDRKRFIKAKYVDKEYLEDLPESDKTVSLQLMDAVRSEDIHQTLLVLAHCSAQDINQLHPPENQSPLHVACSRGLVVLTQLLIWGGGDLMILDGERRTPANHAKLKVHQNVLSVLTANGYKDDLSNGSSN